MSDHKEFLFPITVYWEDTDAGGVVYHANYLRFMERARSESLKSLGCFQMEMARENRAQLVVVSVSIRYRRPALLEDKLVVHSRIVGLKRSIHPELLRRNAEGWLNGHTPFSAIVAFSSYLSALITGKKYIALSNESSANEGNVNGTGVNHQYSKSTEFEQDFREYCAKWLTVPPDYFSLLRPWSEWQIAQRFVQYPKYLPVFRSCNAGSKTDSWCGKCAKCLYVYIMLSAFLDDGDLKGIFGSEMLDDPEFTDLFDGLVYPDRDKPFECVGTRAEVQLALYNAYKRRENGHVPFLLKRYISAEPERPVSLDSFFDRNNFVPEELIGLLTKQEAKD